ncbi:MAG TPA: substrate-binding domain-containing protein [Polyangia bacterium]|jgi:DNA-binding LacI/PurR family transcriptional regulator/signal transduction histidine kinase/ActR/RegA family two-component response regulator|nr:substrate-binding domain-containing protein [Polyangia bacterium]
MLFDHLNSFSGGYEAQLRDAIHAKCREAGHHLLLVYGGPAEAPQAPDAADNAIYALLRPDSADGVIVVSSLLSTYSGPSGVARLVERLAHPTMCSIGIELPGVPSLVLDNRPGMEAVVEHLVRDHGRRKIAFLAGTPENPEAAIRFEAYQAVLTRHGIALDPRRTARGYFRANSAKVAMEEILASGVEIDGVVAANDEMATGAIDLLRKRGLRVPQDVPVTGFDDLTLARLGNPPLTTVAQPFDQVADWAVQAIEEQLAGRAVPAYTEIGARLVRRQSCGCGHQPSSETTRDADRRESPDLPPNRSSDPVAVSDHLEALGPALAELLRTGFSNGAAAATRLLDGLRAELQGRGEAFQDAIFGLLDNAGADNERQRLLHSAICHLREELRGWSSLPVERVLFDGLNLVALSNTTSQMQHRLLLDENYLRLLGVGEQASIAFDLTSLRGALVKGLPSAGVRTAYLACMAGEAKDLLRSAMGLRDGEPLVSDDREYPASQLVPPGALVDDRRESLLVLPLAFENQLLGVIAFSYADGNNGYEAFRNEIAAALKSIRLREELVQTSMLHERSLQERLAATNRMEALSVLAGGVAHDLNNALGPLVALPDVILAQLCDQPGPAGSNRELRADVEAIKVAALRAAQTIKDLLTLGRQGRTAKENLDLNQVVKSCWANGSLRFVGEGSSRVDMRAELSATPLCVRGSEAQLARAVDNLIRNAVEAVAAKGQVVVKSGTVDLGEPRAGYEIIPIGRYATLSISDDGCGIAPHEVGRVFEPFFTKKRVNESSGSGLGLAIVHGVVKEHEGFIDVASTPGVGTTISLYFPRVDGPARTERALAAPRGSARILIVDDEPIQLRTGRRVLASLGYEVEVMESGLGAYELFSRAAASGQSPFDLVIMDMVMGEALDGLQIIEQIRRLFPAQKVIVASGHAPIARAELAVKKDLTWLGKPYGMETLASTVQKVLRSRIGQLIEPNP